MNSGQGVPSCSITLFHWSISECRELRKEEMQTPTHPPPNSSLNPFKDYFVLPIPRWVGRLAFQEDQQGWIRVNFTVGVTLWRGEI